MQVWPKNDDMRKLLKHPNGVAFRPEGPADWPDDSFTARRVRDGDVTTDEPKAATHHERDDHKTKPRTPPVT